eukprot:COSAG06_NODE_14102_length_1190_cov_1.388634_1_plen_98_part_00
MLTARALVVVLLLVLLLQRVLLPSAVRGAEGRAASGAGHRGGSAVAPPGELFLVLGDHVRNADRKKPVFVSIFDMKTIVLPRQAWDKHRGNSPERLF